MRSLSLVAALFLVACAKEGASSSASSAGTGSPPSAAPPTVPAAEAPKTAEEGKPSPGFDVTAHDGARLELGALRGKYVVVYFYPKDETPGCTKEACAFRDAWDALGKKAVLVGVSADSEASHKAFAEHHKLPFHLVTDADKALAAKFGVPFSGMHGRQTVVIAPDGTVKKIYRSVDVSKHAAEIGADVAS
jgi:peroxiredoxin Q/BCP